MTIFKTNYYKYYYFSYRITQLLWGQGPPWPNKAPSLSLSTCFFSSQLLVEVVLGYDDDATFWITKLLLWRWLVSVAGGRTS